MTTPRPVVLQRIKGRLVRLYGQAVAPRLMERLHLLLGPYDINAQSSARKCQWDQRDALLITYPDMLRTPGEQPLTTLHQFLCKRLKGTISSVHLLPFFPSSSDEGFSVIDYRQVEPRFGNWADIQVLGKDFDLMFDLVLNHVSRESPWFRDYVHGVAPACDYFIEVAPTVDISAVQRPRTTPLLSCVDACKGSRRVWTTFSNDQIDLNYANPDVLLEILDVLLYYLSMSTRIIRLDAVAYLRKRPETSCIHLPETHEIVKLLRDVVELTAPGVLVLTETNVPHEDNIRYFGDGDEAHLVYQFSLPPLLLHALITGKTNYLREWVASLAPPPTGCSFLNFTASHDGIGIRPLEGLIPDAEIDALIATVQARGGHVSTRTHREGTEQPYELNITYFDALTEPGAPVDRKAMDRFLCSQTVMLALKGIPAVYFNSLIATRNDKIGVERSGAVRAINRHRWDASILSRLLDTAGTPEAYVFNQYHRLLTLRAAHPGFHPDGEQLVLDLEEGVFGVLRTAPDQQQKIIAISNFTGEDRETVISGDLLSSSHGNTWHELIKGRPIALLDSGRVGLAPYQTLWLTNQNVGRVGRASS